MNWEKEMLELLERLGQLNRTIDLRKEKVNRLKEILKALREERDKLKIEWEERDKLRIELAEKMEIYAETIKEIKGDY